MAVVFCKVRHSPEWEGDKVAVYLFFGREGEWEATSSEALLYVNGEPLQGLDTRHQEAVLPSEYVQGGKELELAVKAFTGMNYKEGAFTQAKLVKIKPAAEEFYYLLRNAFRAALTLMKRIRCLLRLLSLSTGHFSPSITASRARRLSTHL